MSKVEKFSGLLIFLVAAILVLVIIPRSSYSATYRYIPNTVFHWDDPYTGEPLAGGKVYFYAAGTNSDATTVWKDYEGATAHPNPVILDAYGNAQIFGDNRGYKIVVKDSNDVQLESIDGITLFDETSTYASDLIAADDAAAARAVLGLGNSVILDASNGALDLVQLDSDGKLPAVNASNLIGLTTSQVQVMPRSYLSGFKLSNNSSDDENDIDIAAGACRDVNNVTDIIMNIGITKRLDATWTAGTAAGGRSSVSPLNTTDWYHVYAIKSTTGETVDAMFYLGPEASVASAILPTGYTYYRRIGSIITNSTPAIEQFTQYGDKFTWAEPKIDYTNATLAVKTDTLVALDYVPDDIPIEADMSYGTKWPGASMTSLYICSSIQTIPQSFIDGWTDGQIYLCPYWSVLNYIQASWGVGNGRYQLDTTGRVRIYMDAGGSGTTGSVYIVVNGWIDRRGRDD